MIITSNEDTNTSKINVLNVSIYIYVSKYPSTVTFLLVCGCLRSPNTVAFSSVHTLLLANFQSYTNTKLVLSSSAITMGSVCVRE